MVLYLASCFFAVILFWMSTSIVELSSPRTFFSLPYSYKVLASIPRRLLIGRLSQDEFHTLNKDRQVGFVRHWIDRDSI